MENGSKALIMAAGVLLSILVIGLLIFSIGKIKVVNKAKLSEEEQEQLTLFNKEYESYEKKFMYGSDVVTVINKAISNNKKYENNEKVYDIDVEINIDSPIKSYAIKYYTTLNETILTETKNSGSIIDKKTGINYELGEQLPIGTTKLIDNSSDRINDKLYNLIYNGFETKKINIENNFNYTIITSGFADFKRKYFKCESITYDKNTARAKKVVFTEVKFKD